MVKPVVLIDVDGPLNPYAAKVTKRPEGYETHRMKPKGFEYGKGLRVWLNPLHGPSLMATGAELVWATMWMGEANTFIGPVLGLPELPWLRFGMSETIAGSNHLFTFGHLYFKTPRIAYQMLKYHGGKPFIWVDDETTEADELFLKEVCGVNVKVMHIDPRIGLVDDDFETITQWVKENEQ